MLRSPGRCVNAVMAERVMGDLPGEGHHHPGQEHRRIAITRLNRHRKSMPHTDFGGEVGARAVHGVTVLLLVDA